MILVVNGDSHAAAAEATNTFCFAEDESKYFYMGRAPHPDNLRASWGKKLSEIYNSKFYCLAESASSNDRIIRTTKNWINNYPNCDEILLVIGWSTWERQEWLIDGIYYQVNASGSDSVPLAYQKKYKDFIANVNLQQVAVAAHASIWKFHNELKEKKIKHLFFNSNNDFSKVRDKKDWGVHYISPYDPNGTYHNWLIANGFQTVSPSSWHFGQQAHSAWAKNILQYLLANNLY